jgi:hypothetical protein
VNNTTSDHRLCAATQSQHLRHARSPLPSRSNRAHPSDPAADGRANIAHARRSLHDRNDAFAVDGI